MVSILRNIARACFDKTFYQETEKDSFGRRYAHLYVLFMIVVAVFSIQIVGLYVTNQKDINELPQKITSFLGTFYPDDLVLRFNNNELSINQPEPYVLGDVSSFESLEEGNKEQAMDGEVDDTKNLITIDTSATIDDFDTYDTWVLAMKKGVAMKQSDRLDVRYYSYEEFLAKTPQPFTFDSVSYGQIVNKIRPYINQIPSILLYIMIGVVVVLLLVGPLFLASGVLFNILFLAILGYLIAMAIKRKHTYGYIYKLGMYTAIPVIILQQFFGLISFEGFQSIWWLIALLILVIFIPPVGGPLAKVNQTPVSPMDPPKVV